MASSSSSPRTFLITGAARGIGRGISRLLVQQHGARVFLLDNQDDELQHTVANLGRTHQRGRDFDAVLCDLRRPDEIRTAVRRAGEFCSGRLDCLINNAAFTGGVGGSPVADMSLEDWNRSIETNLTGPMLMTQACLPLLRQAPPERPRGGSIVHMSSTRAFMSEPNNEAYSATKAGLLGLSQALAVSLAPDGVRSNAILPGWINVQNECRQADNEGRSWDEGLTKNDHAWHLSGRVGQVDDVLRTVLYLTDSNFVTGAEVVVDGGVTKKMVYPED